MTTIVHFFHKQSFSSSKLTTIGCNPPTVFANGDPTTSNTRFRQAFEEDFTLVLTTVLNCLRNYRFSVIHQTNPVVQSFSATTRQYSYNPPRCFKYDWFNCRFLFTMKKRGKWCAAVLFSSNEEMQYSSVSSAGSQSRQEIAICQTAWQRSVSHSRTSGRRGQRGVLLSWILKYVSRYTVFQIISENIFKPLPCLKWQKSS